MASCRDSVWLSIVPPQLEPFPYRRKIDRARTGRSTVDLSRWMHKVPCNAMPPEVREPSAKSAHISRVIECWQPLCCPLGPAHLAGMTYSTDSAHLMSDEIDPRHPGHTHRQCVLL